MIDTIQVLAAFLAAMTISGLFHQSDDHISPTRPVLAYDSEWQ